VPKPAAVECKDCFHIKRKGKKKHKKTHRYELKRWRKGRGINKERGQCERKRKKGREWCWNKDKRRGIE